MAILSWKNLSLSLSLSIYRCVFVCMYVFRLEVIRLQSLFTCGAIMPGGCFGVFLLAFAWFFTLKINVMFWTHKFLAL